MMHTSGLMAILMFVVAGPMSVAAVDNNQGAASNAAVQKVIQMLQDMLETAKKEKHEEEVKYADFETFCVQETADLKKEIAAAAEQIEKLTSDVAALAKEITELGSDVAGYEADLKAQT